MTRRRSRAGATARRSALPVLAVLLVAGPPAAAQRLGEAPPTRLPPDARFGTSAVQLNVQALNLPPGFGVPMVTRTPRTETAVAADAQAAQVEIPGAGQAANAGTLVFVAADPPPPERVLPGARFSVGSISGFNVSNLSLPPGFGVGAATSAGVAGPVADAGLAARAAVGAGEQPAATGDAAPTIATGPLTFVPAEPPPARVPAGARFGSGGVSFGEGGVSLGQVSNVTFGESAANLGGLGAAFGAGGTDLGGMSVREEAGGLRFTLGADILFDFDKANLRAEADPILRRLVEQVRAEVPRARYMVEGHTDAKGSDTYNLGLSNRRARSVRDWFVTNGAATSRAITTVGLGEGNPVAPNAKPDGSDDPEGRQRNRRVEILVTPLP